MLRAISNFQCRRQISVRFKCTKPERDLLAKPFTDAIQWENARPYDEIPGPKPLPIIGNAWRFSPIGEYGKKDLATVVDLLKRKYGPVSNLSGMPGRPDMIHLYDADDVEKVFRNDGLWPTRILSDVLEYYFVYKRKNILASFGVFQGEKWFKYRSSVNQVLMQPRNIKQYTAPIQQVSEDFIAKLKMIRNERNEMPDDFVKEVSKWALETITYVALDTRLGVLGAVDADSEGIKMIDSVDSVFKCMYKLDILPSPWKYISTPTYREFIRSMDYVTEVSTKYVNEALRRVQMMRPSESEERNYSVLENLLATTGDANIAISTALDMLLNGVDTTTMGTVTTLYQLAIHPEKQRILQKELDRVIPDPSVPLTKEQIAELRYLKACIKEAMRVMPIFLAHLRNIGKDLVLGGYQVPKGTMTTMSHPHLCANERYFPMAQEFIPERWLPSAGDDLKPKHPFAFLAFGFGPRSCAGRRFAELEIETVVAKIFRNFDLEWHQPPPEFTFQFFRKFTSPLKFTVKDRV